MLQVAVAATVAYITVSINQRGSWAGVLAVVIIASVWLLYLRALTPLNERLEQVSAQPPQLYLLIPAFLAVSTTSSFLSSPPSSWRSGGRRGMCEAGEEGGGCLWLQLDVCRMQDAS